MTFLDKDTILYYFATYWLIFGIIESFIVKLGYNTWIFAFILFFFEILIRIVEKDPAARFSYRGIILFLFIPLTLLSPIFLFFAFAYK